MERIKQVISVIVQVAISRRVRWYRLTLRGRQERTMVANHGGYSPSWDMRVENNDTVNRENYTCPLAE